MATITSVSLDHINSVFGTTVKSPIDIANNIKTYASSNGDNSTSTYATFTGGFNQKGA